MSVAPISNASKSLVKKVVEPIINHLVREDQYRLASFNYAVIGGGISGLSTAYYLQRAFPNAQVTLYEGTDRIGGWLRSFEKDGYLFEGGPVSLRGGRQGLETWRLIEELGLEDQVLLANEASKGRYVVKDGKLNELTIPYILSNYPEVMLEPFRAAGPREETVAKFMTRRLGRDFTYDIVEPMCNGIYGGGIDWLSAAATRPFSMIKKSEYHYGSITAWAVEQQIKSMWKKITLPFDEDMQELEAGFNEPPSVPYSFKRGIQTLSDTLLHAIEFPTEGLPVNVLTNSAPAPQSLQDGKKNAFFECHGTLHDYDHVFLAIQPERALDLLPWDRPEDPLIKYYSTSIVQVWFGWEDDKTYDSIKGFGYLLPSRERELALGVINHHNLFPSWRDNPNQKRLCVMMGGTQLVDAWGLDEGEALTYCRDLIKRHLDVDVPDDAVTSVAKLRNCIPHYVEGHIDKLSTLRSFFGDNTSFVGAGYHGVSVHNCIQSANTAVELFVDNINFEWSPLVGRKGELLRGEDVFGATYLPPTGQVHYPVPRFD